MAVVISNVKPRKLSALFRTAAAVLVTLALGTGSAKAAPGTPPPNVAGTCGVR
jgi:hypothetical protein